MHAFLFFFFMCSFHFILTEESINNNNNNEIDELGAQITHWTNSDYYYYRAMRALLNWSKFIETISFNYSFSFSIPSLSLLILLCYNFFFVSTFNPMHFPAACLSSELIKITLRLSNSWNYIKYQFGNNFGWRLCDDWNHQWNVERSSQIVIFVERQTECVRYINKSAQLYKLCIIHSYYLRYLRLICNKIQQTQQQANVERRTEAQRHPFFLPHVEARIVFHVLHLMTY